MGVNLGDFQHFTVDDFSGGLNEFASPYKLADNELAACQNVSIQTTGSIKSSLGYVPYSVRQSAIDIFGIKGGHRYTASDGTKQVIIYASSVQNKDSYTLYADANDGVFVDVGQMLSVDGKCKFAQYRDTVIASTLGDVMKYYDYDNAAFTKASISALWIRSQTSSYTPEIIFDTAINSVDADGHLDWGAYFYRYTLDYGGVDFLGESSPLVIRSFGGSGEPTYISHMESWVDASTSETNNTDKVEFKKPVGYGSFQLDDGIQRINIYRSSPYLSSPLPSNPGQKNTECFYVGSVSATTYNAASAGALLFTDGGVTAGPTAEYNKLGLPPRGKFITKHDSRVWVANVHYEPDTESPLVQTNVGLSVYSIIKEPHSVMFSTISNHGFTEAVGFRTDFKIEIDPSDGEGITGMYSYRRGLLIIFKANSMWAITGDSPATYAVRQIDANIGCVANDSIDVVDGMLVWLSNAGVYYFDGSKPMPLKTDNIAKSIAAIPNHKKQDACGIYDVGHREYLLAHSGANLRARNIRTSRFSLRTGTWTQEQAIAGTGLFLVQNMPTEKVQVLACRDDDFFWANAPIHKFDVGSTRDHVGSGPAAMTFSFQTKFFDGNSPHMNKNFKAVLFELQTPVDLTLDVVCDNRMDTRLDDGGSFTITKPVTNDLIWADDGTAPFTPARSDQQKWYEEGVNTNIWADEQESGVLVLLDDRCWGKRISLIVSGAIRSQVEIQSMTVFYVPNKGVRQ